MLVVSLAGRAAEELVFETVTTGAANDIEQATRIARAMVTQYGMSEKFGLMGLATQENQYLTGRTVLNCGDATAAEIDTEVMRMLKEAYGEAKRLLAENRDAMDQIAEFLIEKETITGKEFMKIFRKVKGIRSRRRKSSMKKRPEWECGRNRRRLRRFCRLRRISSRPCRTRRFRRIRQTDSRIPEQREEMARLRERKCLRDRRTGRRTKTNKIRMQEGSAVLRESVFPSFIFYSAKGGKK